MSEKEIISYAEAKEKGLDFYFSGNPCKYNQIAPRFIKTRHCSCFICVAKQKFKEAEWDKNNPEKAKERRKRHMKNKRIEKCNPVFIKTH